MTLRSGWCLTGRCVGSEYDTNCPGTFQSAPDCTCTCHTTHKEIGDPMHIIITGNPVDGFTAFGPFETEDDAIAAISEYEYDAAWTMEIQPLSVTEDAPATNADDESPVCPKCDKVHQKAKRLPGSRRSLGCLTKAERDAWETQQVLPVLR